MSLPMANAGHSLMNRYSLLFCAILAAFPVFVPDYPPMVDLSQHAAQVATLVDLLLGRSEFSELLRINWFTPYLLGYLLVAMLTPLFGIVTAAKTVIAIGLASVPLATSYLLSSIKGDRSWAWLTLPTLYGFAFHWGFLNFIVAVPLGLLFLAYVLKHNRFPTISSGITVAIGFSFLFFCHALVALFIGTIAGLDAIGRGGRIEEMALRIAPLLPAIPVMVAWGIITRGNEVLASDPILWDWGWKRAVRIPFWIFYVQGPMLVAALSFAVMTAPLLAGWRMSKQPLRWLPLLACVVVLLFVPDEIFGTAFTYQRFGIFLVPCWLLMLQKPDPPPTGIKPRIAFVAASIATAVWLGLVSYNMYGFRQEAQGFSEAVANIDEGKRILQMNVAMNSFVSPAPVYLHFGSWYQAEHHGLVDFSYSYFPVAVVRYREEKKPADVRIFHYGYANQNVLGTSWGDDYDYLLVRATRNLAPTLFKSAPVQPKLVWSGNGWWLYTQRRDPKNL